MGRNYVRLAVHSVHNAAVPMGAGLLVTDSGGPAVTGRASGSVGVFVSAFSVISAVSLSLALLDSEAPSAP